MGNFMSQSDGFAAGSVLTLCKLMGINPEEDEHDVELVARTFFLTHAMIDAMPAEIVPDLFEDVRNKMPEALSPQIAVIMEATECYYDSKEENS